MKCHQCERPAIWRMGETNYPLCLECADKLQHIMNVQFLQSAAMSNMALDDMDAVVGAYGLPSARIPVRELALAMKGKTVLNNININNSTVGVLNTGDLARIDAVITLTKGTDAEVVGQHLTQLTEAVISSKELTAEQKQAILDLLHSLSEQVIRERKPSVMRALLTAIKEPLQGLAAIVGIVDGLGASIERLLG